MASYIAETLDLSRLPSPAIVTVDYAAEKAALIAGIKARLEAAEIPYNVDGLESDPFVKLAEEFAYRKTLTMAQINDEAKRLTLATSFGNALDLIAATYYADLG